MHECPHILRCPARVIKKNKLRTLTMEKLIKLSLSADAM